MTKQKFGPHTTVHSAALKRALDVIIGLPSVERIIIGPSKGTSHRRPVGSIKLQGIVPNGVKMVGYSDSGSDDVFYRHIKSGSGTARDCEKIRDVMPTRSPRCRCSS